VLIEALLACAAREDAYALLVQALSRVNLGRNAHYPFDVIEEAGAAQRWHELGNLIGRVRWTIAAARSVFEAERARLGQRLRSALPRARAAMPPGPEDDPSITLIDELKALADANDLPGLESFPERIGPFLRPGVAEHYAFGAHALAGADDPELRELGQHIEARLESINDIQETAELAANQLSKIKAKPPDRPQD